MHAQINQSTDDVATGAIVAPISSPDMAWCCSVACSSETKQEEMEMHAASVHFDMPARNRSFTSSVLL